MKVLERDLHLRSELKISNCNPPAPRGCRKLAIPCLLQQLTTVTDVTAQTHIAWIGDFVVQGGPRASGMDKRTGASRVPQKVRARIKGGLVRPPVQSGQRHTAGGGWRHSSSG